MEEIIFEFRPVIMEGADIRIEQGKLRLRFRVTSSDGEDKNPLAGLTYGLVRVRDCSDGYFLWYENNLYYEWRFKDLYGDKLQIEIRKFNKRKNFIKNSGVVFKTVCSYLQFVKAVTDELDNVLINDGFSGQFEDWLDDFPVSQYLKLKWILQNPDYDGTLDYAVLTFSEELELLNQVLKVKSGSNTKTENV